jgi:WD40 repeat protein/serine/threonine protein kinase
MSELPGDARTVTGEPHESGKGSRGDTDSRGPESRGPESSSTIRSRIEKLASQNNSSARYVIGEEVGRGGMGAILDVYDNDLQRSLAMKVMHEDDTEESSAGRTPSVSLKLARFIEEAQVTGQLDHPGVVPVHEMGVDPDGRIYFTMRLVHGRELREVIPDVHDEKGGWTMARALGVLLKVCETMAYAHDKGVVHRDLKPANVMVGRYGEVYVMDWGLAFTESKGEVRIQEGSSPATLSIVKTDRKNARGSSHDLFTLEGSIVGTPNYMPPEQARGQLDKVDHRADIYAVGAMLYHLLCGDPPYQERDSRLAPTTLLLKVLAGPPPPLTQLVPNVPPELDAIYEKAMQREPEQRYASMRELADDLQAYLEGRVVRAHKTGAVIEFRKWVLRNKALAASVTAGVLLAFAGLGSTAYVQAKERRVSDKSAALAAAASGEARAALREANAKSYVANVAAAAVNLEVGNLAEARRRLEDCLDEYRAWEWSHFDLRRDLSVLTLGAEQDEINFVAISPDQKRIVSAAWDTLRLWDAETGQQLATLAGHSDRILSAVFSPDGKRLASDAWDGTVRVWDLESGEPLAVLNVSDPSVSTVTFSPDGRRLAAGSGDDTIHVWDADSGVPLAILRGGEDTGPIQSLCFSPDGNQIASGSAAPDNAVRVWSLATQENFATLSAHTRSITGVRFSRDGGRIASASSDNTVCVWDLARKELLHVLEGHTDSVNAVDLSPDGTRIASASKDGTVHVWDADSGAALHVLEGHDRWVSSVHFSSDGRRLVSEAVDGSVWAWEVESGLALAELLEGDEEATSVASSTDGSFVVTGYANGQVKIWCAGTQSGYATLRGHDSEVSAVAAGAEGTIVSGAHDGTVRVWDGEHGEPLSVLRGHTDRVRSVAIRGERIVSGSDDGLVRVWDLARGGESAALDVHEDWVSCVAISHDGKRFASGDESAEPVLRIWDMATREIIATATGHADSALALAFSPDGSHLVSASADGTLRIWDTADGSEHRALEGHTAPVRSVAFSPDGRFIVSGADDLEVRLWSYPAAEPIGTLHGHEAEVLAVAVGPNSKRIFSAGADRVIRVWDANTQSTLAVLGGHEAEVSSLAASRSGDRLLSGSFDGTVRVWETNGETAQRMWRGLTRARLVLPLVHRLRDELRTRAAVVERLEADDGLDPELRQTALRLAQALVEEG